MFLSSTYFFKRKRKGVATLDMVTGQTIVELVVAIGVFSIIITIAMGGFAQILRNQRQANALLFVNTNVSEALEQVAREIRTGRNFCNADTVDCGSPATHYDCAFDGGGNFTELAFNISREGEDELVVYSLNAANASLEKTVSRKMSGSCTPGTPDRITAERVLVRGFQFMLTGNKQLDGLQTRVTISLSVQPEESSLFGMPPTVLQTTISSRQNDS